MIRLASALAAAAALAACAADIRPDPELDAALAPTGPVTTVRNPDGTATTRIDASAPDAWTRIDLDTGLGGDDAGWDLAARRVHLMVNGGVSGPAGVEVARVDGALADVTTAPADGWITDAADGDDPDAEPDHAFARGDGWYAYDVTTHVLTPRPVVWVLRTGAGAVVALAIEAYYDDAGTSGHYTVRWKPLPPGA